MKKIATIVFLIVGAFINSNGQGLVINEIDYDQPSTDSSEFIELYNSGSSPIDLRFYRVILVNGNNNTPYDSITLPNQMLNAGSYFVICSSLGTVPMCDMSHTTPSTGFIQNGSPDAVAIRNTSTNAIIDAVSYEGNVAPPYISGNGVPIGQSDTGTFVTTLYRYTGIGRFPDGTDTNDDSTDFSRRCITPGTANVGTDIGCTNPVTVKAIVAKKDFSVYPNPSTGVLNIETAGSQFRNASITVSNLLGNEMKRISLKNSDSFYQFSISDLQDGVYFVKVKSDAGNFMQRVILNK